jgi:hypothetical protein
MMQGFTGCEGSIPPTLFHGLERYIMQLCMMIRDQANGIILQLAHNHTTLLAFGKGNLTSKYPFIRRCKMQTRLPPSGDAPPPYTRVIRRVYPYSLRPLVIGISIFGLIWGAAVGVSNIQDVGDEGGKSVIYVMTSIFPTPLTAKEIPCPATKKINAFSVVLAIMYFVIAGVGLFAMSVAIAVRAFLWVGHAAS